MDVFNRFLDEESDKTKLYIFLMKLGFLVIIFVITLLFGLFPLIW